MTDTIRLAKRVAEQFSCSRNEAEQYIAGGWVLVDGVVVEEAGFRIAPVQVLELSADASLVPLAPVTILLHKPAGMSTEEAMASIGAPTQSPLDRSKIRILKRHSQGLSVPCVLEDAASGLLVLTQNWQISRKLSEDARKIEQEIIVEVSGQIAPDGLARLNQTSPYLPSIKVSWQNETRLRFAVKGVQPGQIISLCQQVGLTVVAQKRIRIARIPMAALAVGQWRYLTDYERL
jgi:23S rRNA pseudouridine2604 synthase